MLLKSVMETEVLSSLGECQNEAGMATGNSSTYGTYEKG